ncbi:scytonemin biosynthesis PEP-CTERM protein ScyF [Synechocystis sp. PCC 7509]|uniref:scytonemin biosynthesis PEP-CTERM protein ScyF n=1 Tax=Synechocystis sp. PCC 7509 TaxID=927677 RepID=UPI0002ACC526|nr:scytonemin biosynthesis PEP-CTERM protein ScyF [Synechocystis sp. PCC 7509]
MELVKNLSFAIVSSGLMFLVTTQAQAASISLSYDSSIGRPANFAAGENPFTPGTIAIPQGIAVQEGTGNVFVANDVTDQIQVFNSEGNFLQAFGGKGSGPGQFDGQSAIAFEPNTGNFYAGDVVNNRINIFDPQGNYLKSIAQGQFSGLVEGRPFYGPSGIVFDNNGNGFVGDYSSDRILKFNSSSGEVTGSIGSNGTAPGQFQGPSGVGITPDGNLVVTDQFNNRIQVIDQEGKALLTFGKQGTGDGEFNQPIDAEVDEEGNIYVTDSINSRVQIFDKSGNFLSAFGEPARDAEGNVVPPLALGAPSPYGDPLDLEPGKFNWTAGSDLVDDKLYVGDFFQGRVQVLNVNRTEPVPEPTSMLGLAVLGGGALMGKLKQRQKQKAVKA